MLSPPDARVRLAHAYHITFITNRTTLWCHFHHHSIHMTPFDLPHTINALIIHIGIVQYATNNRTHTHTQYTIICTFLFWWCYKEEALLNIKQAIENKRPNAKIEIDREWKEKRIKKEKNCMQRNRTHQQRHIGGMVYIGFDKSPFFSKVYWNMSKIQFRSHIWHIQNHNFFLIEFFTCYILPSYTQQTCFIHFSLKLINIDLFVPKCCCIDISKYVTHQRLIFVGLDTYSTTYVRITNIECIARHGVCWVCVVC